MRIAGINLSSVRRYGYILLCSRSDTNAVRRGKPPSIGAPWTRTTLACLTRMKSTRTITALAAGVAIAACGTLPSYAAQLPEPRRAQRPASPKTGSVRITVKDQDGTGVSEARLVMSGPAEGEFVTGGAGTTVVPNLKE